MAQRRKIEIPVTNKPDFALDFQHVAAEVAKLYNQSVNLQPSSFDAGRKHSLTKAYDWISSQIQEGKSVTSTDIIIYVQNELNKSLSTDFHLNGEASSSSTTSIENREPGENVPQDMEEDPPHV
ncbi:hypothetical protein L1987_83952 [Smallanthus sonchifolius]|uniref:Uncharacterized protein n=1 Tax=Smallanthus sonchifolius TaxID=185202 RepID=A0ACB8YEV1_9ASTR|nr:hypothetical protein L1987_83952 [Smallanthus sonchifolius]